MGFELAFWRPTCRAQSTFVSWSFNGPLMLINDNLDWFFCILIIFFAPAGDAYNLVINLVRRLNKRSVVQCHHELFSNSHPIP
jgi:hypothetical protein